MSEAAASYAWRRDTESSKKGLIASVLFHGAVGVAFILNASGARIDVPRSQEPSLKIFDVPGPVTNRPLDEDIAVAEPKAAITEALPKPSDAEIAKMAVPEGGSGSDVMVWTPPQPGYSYAGTPVKSGTAGSPAYVDIPIPLITMPGEELVPLLARFDGALFIEVAKKFGGLGVDRKVALLAEVAVDAEGKPLGCSIVEGQVSAQVDTLGCQLLMANTYRPARDRGGKAVVGFARANVAWDGARFSVVEGKRELALNQAGQVQLADLSLVDADAGDAPLGIVDPSR